MGTRDAPDQILLTVEEASKFLNVSRATVYRLVKKGIFEKVKEPGKRTWLIPMDSLNAYELGSNMTLPEIAARIIQLERKVDFLLARDNPTKGEVAAVGVNFLEMRKQMQKRHPEKFKN